MLSPCDFVRKGMKDVVNGHDHLSGCNGVVLVLLTTCAVSGDRIRVTDLFTEHLSGVVALPGRQGFALTLDFNGSLLLSCQVVTKSNTNFHIKFSVHSPTFTSTCLFSTHRLQTQTKKASLMRGQKGNTRFIDDEEWKKQSFIVDDDLFISFTFDLYYSHWCYHGLQYNLCKYSSLSKRNF